MTALEEESAIISKQERYKGEAGTPVKCGNCGKLGHFTQACFLRKTPRVGRTEVSQARVSQARREGTGRKFEVICYNCETKGHYARDCPRNNRKLDREDTRQEKPGNGNRLSEGSRPTVSSTH